MSKDLKRQFHGYYDIALRPDVFIRPQGGWGRRVVTKHTTVRERKVAYQFYPHFHPFVEELLSRLLTRSVSGLQGADTEYSAGAALPNGSPRPTLYDDSFFARRYQPSSLVRQPYPVRDLDFSSSGPYAPYNWELFFHVPTTIAIHLSRNQRFKEAQRWFHFVFDPTDNSDDLRIPAPARFWKVRPFQFDEVHLVEEILRNLSTGQDSQLQEETIHAIGAWKDTPFRPHAVARYRPTAYMFKAVMAYLDNLIAWGDSLFRQDTIESINEATQQYVLCANILGSRPQPVPKKGTLRPATYESLRKDLDAFSNALRELETDIPFDAAPHPGLAAPTFGPLRSIGRALYFAVPRNDRLLAYWDTVGDRLFKIHNSLNLQGVFRQLPLFDPPIDPALLARAAATGLDVGAVVSGAYQPLPIVRFALVLQKALEICQEVKSLGSQLLSSIEKEDGETLGLLRAKHERTILGLAETIKYQQWQEAIKNHESLQTSFDNALERYFYYERLLGKSEAEIKKAIPALDALDTAGLAKMSFRSSEPALARRAIDVDIAQGAEGITGGKKISSHELLELQLLEAARGEYNAAAVMELLGSYLSLIPQFGGHATPIGVGAAITFGGEQLSKMMSMMALVTRTSGDQLNYEANKSAKIGGYARREQEWAYQSNLAAGEINQVLKQLRAAEIRKCMAEREWRNHQQQIKHAEEIEQFLTDERTGKLTNQAFYAWMRREVKGLYGQCFQLAFEVAKKAERALQHELGAPSSRFVESSYLAGKEGLLAGERLHLDLKRMELAYHEQNVREYELEKRVSLRQLDPRALLMLRAVGRCQMSLPEELFDLDGPGHYFRRIRSVAMTIAGVSGPFTGVNCTLRLVKSGVRKSPLLGDGYKPAEGFDDYLGSVQGIVTSSGLDDMGVFDPGSRDERRLPFEGCGVISTWQLELPADPSKRDPQQFDYGSISDVVLRIRYTAREGGAILKRAAMANLAAAIERTDTTGPGHAVLISVRHDFPDTWARFKAVKIEGNTKTALLALDLTEAHYPFWSRGRVDVLRGLEVLTDGSTDCSICEKEDGSGEKDKLDKDPERSGLRKAKVVKAVSPLPGPVGPVCLLFDNNEMSEMWMVVEWGKK